MRNSPFARGLVRFVVFWAAVLLMLGYVSVVANAGPLAERYERLQEIGRIDMTNAGAIMAVEPLEPLLLALQNDIYDVEEIEGEDGKTAGLLVRADFGEKGALWHIVLFAVDENTGRQVGVIFWGGHELPTQPA